MYSVGPASSYSSSPPSSPIYVDSSSPASSLGPDVHIQDEEDIPPLSLNHPFAASAGAKWRPPQYEKKRSNPLITPPATAKRPRITYNQPDSSWPSSPTTSTFSTSPISTKTTTRRQMERKIWEDAAARAVDQSHGAIALDDHNLTFIPDSFVDDLAAFYVPPESSELINSAPWPVMSPHNRPLTRVATEPAINAENATRYLERSRSAALVSFGLPREKLQLFLSSNQISTLPSSLFSLQNLTVLSLRSNRITYIPPEIIGLKNLEDLNIAQNQIKYLPAEMLQMSLKSLHLHPNSFIAPPTSSDGHFLRSSSLRHSIIPQRRPVSETNRLDAPSLVEHLFRHLLSPADKSGRTVFEKHYNLPLAESFEPPSAHSPQRVDFVGDLPDSVRKILHTCLPGSVYIDGEGPEQENHDTGETSRSISETPEVTGVGLCPSPKHQQLGTKRVFVRHAEERFTWETMIGGVPVGGRVPVRWRGCQFGCLDFLDPPREEKQPAPEIPDIDGIDIDDDGEDIEGVVQPFQAGGLSDFDD
ncbi:putative leucine-rich repeats, typical (most populated) subfamily protein [Lyophyllum shimeji]|uniref:Leucine-rich repeats, typical (Most populated) subfamily protein n=1 Tax=Lyophyllum shimeji TaxID=47721 RepID=A0A9P3URW4_LYOSH|nr:putative leucine-rich repeats, typical (most populated) subfamily protein [Lyophyllum shimeji]